MKRRHVCEIVLYISLINVLSLALTFKGHYVLAIVAAFIAFGELLRWSK
jgi:hypothetical protein